jgi:6-pyruvoyltetrahydropterin/6-carboxytetrahydropterin synthase
MPAKSSRRTARPSSGRRPAKAPAAPAAGPVYITRQVHFNAAHRLHNPARSQAWNTRMYGLCTNPHWHGHNYVLEATVVGHPSPETGYILDLGELKRILNDAVVTPCDHRNLNEEVPFLKGTNPSTENLVIAFWNRIAPRLPAGKLYCVRLYETPRNFAEYYGPEGRR